MADHARDAADALQRLPVPMPYAKWRESYGALLSSGAGQIGRLSAWLGAAQRVSGVRAVSWGEGNVAFDYRDALDSQLDRLEVMTGYRLDVNSIDKNRTFMEWCEALAKDGMKIDGKPFNLDERPALRPLYEAIPSTPADAKGCMLIVMKATQLGLTVWEVLANIYMATKWEPLNIGMFMPDQATASFKSEHRFMRIVRSVPQIYRRLVSRTDEDGKDRRVGEGNVLTRTLGESILMFLWTSGKVTTESRPMDVVTLDEVQEMTLHDIDKAQSRTGDSLIDFKLMLSTANMPDLDIDFWYRLGTQEEWHTRCGSCGELSDLSDPAKHFPKRSIEYNTGDIDGAPLNEYCWTCPLCRAWIPDPQVGAYVVKNPAAGPKMRSFLLPRVISPRVTARDAAERFSRARTADQKKSFYNRFLARPYIDAEQLPVTMAHCMACVEAGRRAGVTWKDSAKDTFMGIDQMGSFNAVIIKERMPDGRQAVVHVEAVFDDNPFERCAAMMKQYGVSVCVVEQLPNVNDARRFANRFPGRVFLAGYADLRDDFMTWGDDLSKSDMRTDESERTRRTVTLNQYKCMMVALHRVRDTLCLFPDPEDKIVEVIEDGQPLRMPILRDWVFMHFTKTALVVEQKDDERKPRARVLKIGIDPHFSFANMLCDVAWARSYGTSQFILPQGGSDYAEKLEASAKRGMPGLPTGVTEMLLQGAAKMSSQELCGNCEAFEAATRRCKARNFQVQASDPGCEVYVAAS